MISIGSGSRYRPDAGRAVLRDGVDYLFMDFMSESTLPRAYLKKRRGRPGFDGKWLTRSLEAFLPPAERHGTTILTNAGAADPLAAGEAALDVAREVGVPLEVTVVTGDDCTDLLRARPEAFDVDPDAVLSANAYIGAEEIVGALADDPARDGDGVHMVVGGRIADHSLVVAPLVHEFGWDLDQWEELGQATVVAQLLECDYQATGGYFMEAGRKPVPDPHVLGLPIADVYESGRAVVRKPEGSGGRIDRATLREQLFYEIHDPSAKLTPDVTADLTDVRFEEVGEDEVAVTGGTGRERPDELKVLVGTEGGFRVEARKPYAGPNAEGRARMAGDIVRDRLDLVHEVEDVEELRVDVVGVDAVFGSASTLSVPFDGEVELRVAARTATEETAELVYDEVSSLAPVGPAAGVGNPYSMNDSIERIVDVDSVFLPREAVVGAIERHRLRTGAVRAGDAPAADEPRTTPEPGRTDGYWTPEELRDWVPADVDEAERLYDIAHARAGDKGDVSNIVITPFEDEAFETLVEVVTVERVEAHFDGLVEGEVERYCVPSTNCINLVLRRALDGGVASSLRLDRYGKSLSRHLLAMPVARDADHRRPVD